MKKNITLPLDIPDVEVVKTAINALGAYIITVKSTLNGTKCQHCGREISKFQGYGTAIELRHLPILGRPVYIRIRPQRYRCPYCDQHPTSTQRVAWYTPKSRCTQAFEEHILRHMVHNTIQDVSCQEQVSYNSVVGMLDRRVQEQVDWAAYTELGVLGIDEIARRKGHRDFLALITARLPDQRIVILAVLPNRLKTTVQAFLDSIPQRLRRTIHTVCTDMWAGYVNAVYASFGPDPECEVQVVIDRYHVAKEYRACADRWRKQELKRLKQELPQDEYRQFKGALWAFRKSHANLKPEERACLECLFAYAPQLRQAYLLREELTAIFDARLTKAQAIQRLNAWCTAVRHSRLTCFDAFLTTLDNWLDEITNYFPQRYSSGFVEGFNNKVKVLKRRCYGILNVGHIFQRLFLDLDGYRCFAPAYP